MCLGVQVREACSLLDLDVLFYPCPKDGPNWRPKVGTRSSLLHIQILSLSTVCIFSLHSLK